MIRCRALVLNCRYLTAFIYGPSDAGRLAGQSAQVIHPAVLPHESVKLKTGSSGTANHLTALVDGNREGERTS